MAQGKVTWDGETVTWDSTGSKGTFVGDYLINWARGGQWVKKGYWTSEGQWIKQGKRNIIYHY